MVPVLLLTISSERRLWRTLRLHENREHWRIGPLEVGELHQWSVVGPHGELVAARQNTVLKFAQQALES